MTQPVATEEQTYTATNTIQAHKTDALLTTSNVTRAVAAERQPQAATNARQPHTAEVRPITRLQRRRVAEKPLTVTQTLA